MCLCLRSCKEPVHGNSDRCLGYPTYRTIHNPIPDTVSNTVHILSLIPTRSHTVCTMDLLTSTRALETSEPGSGYHCDIQCFFWGIARLVRSKNRRRLASKSCRCNWFNSTTSFPSISIPGCLRRHQSKFSDDLEGNDLRKEQHYSSFQADISTIRNSISTSLQRSRPYLAFSSG